jgi:hypothetical protein
MQSIFRTLAVLSILTVFSAAQQTPATTTPKASTGSKAAAKPGAGASTAGSTEARHKAAMGLIELLLPRQNTDQMIGQIGQQFMYAAAADYKRRGITIPPDFESKMKAAMTGLVSYDEVTNWAADFYAQQFTVPELHQMAVFYQGPLGRKLIKAQPLIGQETMRKLLITVDHRLPAAMQKQGLTPPVPRSQSGEQQPPSSEAPQAPPK